MYMTRIVVAGFIAASTSMALAGTGSAAPLLVKNDLVAANNHVTNVRWRGGWHHGHRGWHHGYRGWRHGYYHRGPGWGPALGGLAAGAIIGGAIANSNASAANADAYCSSRFRSYDPTSGTYLGYDGNRHPCP